MADTRYDRFFEMHLVGLGEIADPSQQLQLGKERYDFAGGAYNYWMAYIGKHLNDISVGAKQIDHVLGNGGERAEFVTKQILEPLRYCSCFVSLESLKPGQPTLPELASVVEWVSADKDGNGRPIKGKLRINSHGSDASGAGFSMGTSRLSPNELVDALIRHGLAGRRRPEDGVQRYNKSGDGPLENSRWKADREMLACETCKKSFTFVRRRHHCRRCGGLFCDECTKSRMTLKDPLTEAGRTKGTVQDCRVCDVCRAMGADDHLNKASKAETGLTQITLACCLTARTEQEFGSLRAGFAPKSIAGRFVRWLSSQGIHGIQVSGSNEVLNGDDNREVFGIGYPGAGGQTLAAPFAPSEFAGWQGAYAERHRIRIPASVLGSDPTLRDDPRYKAIRNVKITPALGGSALAFGHFYKNSNEERLVRKVLEKWRFLSWGRQDQEAAPVLMQSARLAGPLSEERQPARREFMDRAVDVIGGRGRMMTIVFTAPQRNLRVHEDPENRADWLILDGFETRFYKDYKITAIS